MPVYKLYYFPVKGRGEVIRLIFACAGVGFEDIRIPFEEWPARKHEMPFGQIPILEVDGKKMSQSSAVCRYLAREFNLYGKDNYAGYKSDEFGDAMYDVMLKLPWAEKDEKKKEELTKIAVNETIPPMLLPFEEYLQGDYWAGELTIGDITFATCADHLLSLKPDIFDATPKLKALKERVFSIPNIAKYVATRPKTNM
uniref:glutathione transferase n=1 Tax=Ciona intestinalis TaxID=7719 RepID=Q0PMD5_CIOIN|nr:prostaglandin D synthase-like isoform 1 [Ciona intestinalis]